MTAERVRYQVGLTRHRGSESASGRRVRTVTPEDRTQLAEVMLDGYRGTMDYADEDLDDARAEIDWFFGSAPIIDHSFVVEADGKILSAVLVTLVMGTPFFA